MKIDLVSKPYECHDTCETCHDGSCGGGKWLHSYGVNIMGFGLLKNGGRCCSLLRQVYSNSSIENHGILKSIGLLVPTNACFFFAQQTNRNFCNRNCCSLLGCWSNKLTALQKTWLPHTHFQGPCTRQHSQIT